MKFELKNNHMIVSVNTQTGSKTCIFDTGAPYTFFFENIKEYYIDGISWKVEYNPMFSYFAKFRVQIENMIGCHIDGFIGTDCMKGKCVVINFINQELSISSSDMNEGIGVSMNHIYGLPIFEMSINGIAVNSAFDSGAMFSFIDSNLIHQLQLKPQGRNYKDFNPLLGAFTASLYTGNIYVGTTELEERNIAVSPAYDRAMSMIGVDAFIGIDSLKETVLCLSYINNRITII